MRKCDGPLCSTIHTPPVTIYPNTMGLNYQSIYGKWVADAVRRSVISEKKKTPDVTP